MRVIRITKIVCLPDYSCLNFRLYALDCRLEDFKVKLVFNFKVHST